MTTPAQYRNGKFQPNGTSLQQGNVAAARRKTHSMIHFCVNGVSIHDIIISNSTHSTSITYLMYVCIYIYIWMRSQSIHKTRCRVGVVVAAWFFAIVCARKDSRKSMT